MVSVGTAKEFAAAVLHEIAQRGLDGDAAVDWLAAAMLARERTIVQATVLLVSDKPTL